MTAAAWALTGLAVALLPLGSRGSLRLASLSGVDAAAAPFPTVDIDLSRIARPAASMVGLLVAVTVGPALGAAAALIAITGLSLAAGGAERRRARSRRRTAILVVQVVQAELDAGAGPAGAVQAASSVGGFTAELAAIAEALRHARDPTVDVILELRPLAHAVRVCSGSGAPTSAVLETVRAQLQDAEDRSAAVAAALAGARSSAMLLAILPALGIALGAGLGVNPLHVLFASSAGHGLVLIGVVLECAGLWWTSRLAARAEDA